MNPPVASNIEVVVFVLGKLGGGTKTIPTELIAYECFRIAPDRFSWVTEDFSGLPDKLVAKTALEDAAKAKYGSLVAGKYARDVSLDGWALTASGIRWLDSNATRIAAALGIPGDQTPRLRPLEVRRLRSRLQRHPAFQQFLSSGGLEHFSRFTLADLLQASPDASPELMRFKFDRLAAAAELAKDPAIISFVRALDQRYPVLFPPQQDNSDE